MQITEDEFTRALVDAYRTGYRAGYVNSRTDAVNNVYDPDTKIKREGADK